MHANNRRERETQATSLQENTAYNINQRSLTQTDNKYSTVENTGYITYDTAGDTKSNESSVLDNKSNTKRIRQEVAKNEYGKKWFAIFAVIAFVLSLLVAVAALVYTNIELKNQMISTNKQLQSMNEQLNNQSSQQIQILQAQFSHSILLLQNNFSEQLSSANKQVKSTNEQLNNQSSQQIQILQAQFSHSILLLQNNFSEQLSSTNKQVQSTNEQLNNQSSQLSNSILALSSNISGQNEIIIRDLNGVQSIITDLGPMAFYPGTRIGNPASSCKDIPQDRPSGEYWNTTDSTSSPVQVYCDMNRTSCSCNTTGGWMRVANLDMTDPNQNCPEELMLVTREEPPLRTCGRHAPGCVSTTYSTYGVEYSKVCGRIIRYQSGSPDALHLSLSIDDVYVDGVSLTHGQSPRQHIWTFINAIDETRSDTEVCPCTRPDLPYTGVVPPFIGKDYFCETGSRQEIASIFYPNDPLWDGQGCGSNSTCCEFNNPPWFCKQLPQPTTDDIELRLCANQPLPDEDIPIEIVEIYIL